MNVKIEQSWKNILSAEFDKDYFKKLTDFVKQEKENHTIYPIGSKIFAAFDYCTFDRTRVVIIGQDPYHGAGQANGLCFSVADNIAIPPSLKNIYKELHTDIGKPIPSTGNLENWAKQGVLLLNATLTVRAESPGTHQKKGWEQFTDAVIQALSDQKSHLVFLLWGSYAQKKGAIIDESKHMVLKAVHPSPLASHRGFFGCKNFSQTNEYLAKNGKKEIEW